MNLLRIIFDTLTGRSLGCMSRGWLHARAAEETKIGWEGPRWRLTSER